MTRMKIPGPASEWRTYYYNVATLNPESLAETAVRYNTKISMHMRQIALPERLAVFFHAFPPANFDFVGIGTAINPDFSETVEKFLSEFPHSRIRAFLIDPGYTHEKIRDIAIRRLRHAAGIEGHYEVEQSKDKYENTMYTTKIGKLDIFLCDGAHPYVDIPDSFYEPIVTIFNTMSYINQEDIHLLLQNKKIHVLAIADTPNRGFNWRDPWAFQSFDHLVSKIKREGFLEYVKITDEKDKDTQGYIFIRPRNATEKQFIQTNRKEYVFPQ
ncbi:MAG: hypothetical protein ACREGI_03225 [Candidatus Levyibacteriota bacterium]